MNKIFKKVLSVVLALVMVVTSITVYNSTAKADGEVAVEVTAQIKNGMIEASWKKPEGFVQNENYATLAYYVNKADDIVLDADHYAKASNGWVWTANNPTEDRTALDSVVSSSDGSVVVLSGDDLVITVQYVAEDGTVVAQGTSNVVRYVNYDLNLNYAYGTDKITFSWSAITGATKYVVYDGDDVVATLGSNASSYEMNVEVGVTYNIIVKAYGTDDTELTVTNNAKVVQYAGDGVPFENDINKVDTSAWTALEVKAGEVEEIYSVNATHGLSQSVWWGIYAPHSDANYHGERDKCILGEAAAFVFQQSDIKEIWVNGTKYENPSTGFNNQGDCAEISVDVLTEEENVITLALNDGTMKTFAIKVEVPKKQYNVTVDGGEATPVEEGNTYELPADATLGYYCDGKMYKAGSEVEVTKNMAFVSVDEVSVTMTEGASIRTEFGANDTTGLRFKATATSDNADLLANQDILTTGMLITTKAIYENTDADFEIDSVHTKINVVNSGWYNETVGTYCASVVNIAASNYVNDYVAKAYATINYADGKTETVYSNAVVVRSPKTVATNIIADTVAYDGLDAAIKSVIDTIAAAQ